ncbi:MAG: GTPase RsgA, partial [Acidobacteriota bacterium]
MVFQPLFPEASSLATHSLRDLGFDQEIERRFDDLRARSPTASVDWIPARVVSANRELYKVATSDGVALARPSGRLRRAGLPAVGDWVAVGDDGGGGFVLYGIVERRAVLSRNVAGQRTDEQIVAANVDIVFLVMGLDGDYNLRRLERFAVMTAESGADGVVVLTKADLAEDPVTAVLDARGVVPGLPVFAVSALVGDGL